MTAPAPLALPRVVLLDLDDTILDMSGSAVRLWEALCHRRAREVGGAVDATTLLQALRDAVDRFWADAESRRWGGFDLPRARRVIASEAFSQTGAGNGTEAFAFADTFTRERLASIEAFPGAIETVEALRARGHRLGLVTNGKSRTQREKIDRFDLARRFDAIAVEEEFGVGKPDPRVFRHVLDRLGATPGEAWMVGDNLEADVRGAQGAGVHAVWHDVAGRGLAAGAAVRPDRVIHRVAELLEG